jgi:acetyltransferase-like isoleucine patch superfamily enzyme
MNFLQLFNRDNGLEVRLWTAIYRRCFGRLGPGSILSRAEQILNPQFIYIGAQVLLAHDARLDAIRAYAGQSYQGEIHIGDRTIIQPRVHLAAAAKLVVGSDTLIGSNVFITDHDHGFDQPNQHVAYQPLVVAPTCIQDHAWLGENVVVLKGVTIGHHAIIGANSVVTRTILPYAVAAGAPARVIRMRPETPSKS